MNNFFSELKRRNVYKAAVSYAVVAWLLIQIATQVFPFLEIPAWAIRLVIVLLALGFPVALLLAWALELTPEGIRRTSETGFPGRSGRSWLWVVLIAAIGAGSLLWFQLTARVKTPEPGPKSIAVLPFENLSENKETSYFVDGIQDEVITRLAKIGELRVISRTSRRRATARTRVAHFHPARQNAALEPCRNRARAGRFPSRRGDGPADRRSRPDQCPADPRA